MRDYPRNAAEIDELEMFFLRLARAHKHDLHVRSPSSEFVLKHGWDGVDLDNGCIDVNVDDLHPKLVRLDRRCGAGRVHEALEKMRVPHEYEKQGFQEELRISPYHARKHLDKALAMAWKKLEQKCEEHTQRLAEGTSGKGKGPSHSRF